MSDIMGDVLYTKNLLEKYGSKDSEVFQHISKELDRQHHQIELIASENFVSTQVLAAMGSIFTNKYAEGYPGKRYYGGCENVDEVENIAISRACKLFGCNFANVQPHSGAQANTAVFFAFLKPGDTFLGMDLAAGGHLTHGAKPTVSGKWFNAINYGVNKETGFIDYDEVERLALEHKPKLIIAGGSSYPRLIDFARFSEIAKKVGAILMADVAHYAGLICTSEYNNPFPYADVVTTTTHKTLRGPRGGMILWNDEKFNVMRKVENYTYPSINGAVFPGIQGGPLMHVIAGKAVAFGEALKPEFKIYAQNVKKNAKILGETLAKHGAIIMTGGTDCHMVIANVYDGFGVTGREAEHELELAGITCNKNAIPFDALGVTEASGIRLGSPAATTRGFDSADFIKIGKYIVKVLNGVKKAKDSCGSNESARKEVLMKIQELCKKVNN
jgi:glycine hydroxymethyltransferase